KTTSAWTTFKAAAAAARSAKQEERGQVARERAAALEARLSRIVLNAPPYAASTIQEVTRDGRPVSRASWGIAVPVDPGRHVLAAVGVKGGRWTQEVNVAEGETATVEVPIVGEQASAPASRHANDSGARVPSGSSREPVARDE